MPRSLINTFLKYKQLRILIQSEQVTTLWLQKSFIQFNQN